MSSFIKSAKSIVPTFDRVLIQRLKPVQQTASGIYIPEKNLTKPNVGSVIAVGPGYTTNEGTFIKPAVAVGDKVLLPQMGGSKVVIDPKAEDEFILFRDSEILAKIEE